MSLECPFTGNDVLPPGISQGVDGLPDGFEILKSGENVYYTLTPFSKTTEAKRDVLGFVFKRAIPFSELICRHEHKLVTYKNRKILFVKI